MIRTGDEYRESIRGGRAVFVNGEKVDDATPPPARKRKPLAFARDLINRDHDGHRLALHLFAQSAPFSQLGAVYSNFDFDGPLDLARKASDLSDQVTGDGRVLGATSRSQQDVKVAVK